MTANCHAHGDAHGTADHAGHSGHGGHTHGPRGEEVAHVSDARLLWAVVLNQLLTVAEVAAGILSGSVALLSDAAHNFNDANALFIAYIARRVSRRRSNARYTFGYRRAEMIGAMINLTLLGVAGAYLVYEGVWRFFEPEPIESSLMAAASIVALVVDIGTALLLWTMSQGSLNVRAAFIHNLVDALGSLAVLIGAGAIYWFGWLWVDPVLTLLIAGYILWQVYAMLPQAIHVLMEGAPDDLDLDQLIDAMSALDGVAGVHHVHVWQLDERHRALEAHVVIAATQAANLESVKQRVKATLAEEFSISHSTLEMELAGENDNCIGEVCDHGRGV
jgi:cobalt-zinc-cadmium efflux system protein